MGLFVRNDVAGVGRHVEYQLRFPIFQLLPDLFNLLIQGERSISQFLPFSRDEFGYQIGQGLRVNLVERNLDPIFVMVLRFVILDFDFMFFHDFAFPVISSLVADNVSLPCQHLPSRYGLLQSYGIQPMACCRLVL